MIKTIEIAPDIVAHGLAKYLFDYFGTVKGDHEEREFVLDCSDVDELRKVIQDYLAD